MTKIFDKIDEKEKQKLLKMIEAVTLTFNKNRNILTVLNNENIIGIITKGYIQITRIDTNGNRTIIEELEEDDVFGSIISSLENNEYEIITKENTELIIIDYEIFLKYDGTNKSYYQQFLKNIFDITMQKTKERNERIEILTKKTIRDKLLEYFKIISKKRGSKYIYLPFTFTDLADYLAVDRSAMTREMKNLKEEGLIEVKGKKITLLYNKDSSVYL